MYDNMGAGAWIGNGTPDVRLRERGWAGGGCVAVGSGGPLEKEVLYSVGTRKSKAGHVIENGA